MSQQPYEQPPGETTQEFRNQPMPPQQTMWQGQRGYGGMRPRLRVRSTFLTTEFWIFVVVSFGILIASAVDDGPGDLGFSAGEAWKLITWLAIAYMLSRGLTKLSGAPRDGGSPDTEL